MAGLPFTESEDLNRQKNGLDELPSESVLFIPTNPRAVRSNDVSYPFRASSYILYLCGWTEPDGIFVARKSSGNWKTILFVQPRDTKSEIWEGIRGGGEGAAHRVAALVAVFAAVAAVRPRRARGAAVAAARAALLALAARHLLARRAVRRRLATRRGGRGRRQGAGE